MERPLCRLPSLDPIGGCGCIAFGGHTVVVAMRECAASKAQPAACNGVAIIVEIFVDEKGALRLWVRI